VTARLPALSLHGKSLVVIAGLDPAIHRAAARWKPALRPWLSGQGSFTPTVMVGEGRPSTGFYCGSTL
jgi:hypothetical protein